MSFKKSLCVVVACLVALPVFLCANDGVRVKRESLDTVDDIEYLFVEIENTSGGPLSAPGIRVIWQDANKVTVKSSRYRVPKKTELKIGDTFTFKVRSWLGGDIEHYAVKTLSGESGKEVVVIDESEPRTSEEIERDNELIRQEEARNRKAREAAYRRAIEIAKKQASGGGSVKVMSVNFNVDDSGIARISGEVKNDTDQTISSIKLIASFYDKSKKFVATDWAFAEYDSLRPGQVSPYEISSYDSAVVNSSRVKVGVEWR